MNLEEKKIANFDDLMIKYSLALEMLETELRVSIKDYEYNKNEKLVDHIKSRIKTKESIINKLERKNYEVNCVNIIKHIHDVIGIRIVCPFLSNVYEIVNLIKSNKRYIIKEEKDYIKNPKDTGYISYHIIMLVPVYLNGKEIMIEAEIQIRTMAMDFWASLDHMINYKCEDIPEDVKNEIFNCSLDIKSLDEKMEQLKDITKIYRQ